jgi:hypothetical protein
MRRFDGSLARKLDFDGTTSTTIGRGHGLRLLPAHQGLRGPDKYKLLEHRRRQAQIRARRLLDVVEGDAHA